MSNITFRPSGALFRYILSSTEEKKEFLKEIDVECKNMVPICPINPNDEIPSKNSDISEDENHDYRSQQEIDIEYYNIINGYDDEFFRLMEIEEKMCEGLAEEPETDSMSDDETD